MTGSMTSGDGGAGELRVALVQTSSGDDMAENIRAVSAEIRKARAEGAAFVFTPEMVSLIEMSARRAFEKTAFEADDPALPAFRGLAAELGIWLSLGSLPIKCSDTKIANRSFLIDPAGEIVARYDKIHMFDVDLGGGESYRESKSYEPGTEAVLAETPWGSLGMTVCYDMRFPHLYRSLAQAGARLFTVPAAFTRPTGRAHWHVLLRARAIETGAFVIAAAQCGVHPRSSEGKPRETYGHSLVVAPWGEIVAEAGEAPEILYADLDLSLIDQARAQVPSLGHDRAYVTAVPRAVPAAARTA